MAKTDDILTSKMAAELLGFSQDYIRRLCLAGTIKAVKRGHDWIFSKAAIKDIKRQRKKKEN